jgi:hypothetical protein
MKANLFITLTTVCCLLDGSVFGQGALTPPAAPGPTMLTLSQVEPRTPISSVPFTITKSGSYYLTTNLTATVSNAITIAASGVSLDLEGFTISSTVANAANGGAAILFDSGLGDIAICNGHIRGGVNTNGTGMYIGSGFGYGINASDPTTSNVRVTGISVSGCLYNGISPGLYSTEVDSCTIFMVGGFGIVADNISHSTALYCGNTAIDADAIASDCFGYCTGNGDGVGGITLLDCQGYCDGTGDGVAANVAKNCYAWSNGGGDGVNAQTADNCTGQGLTGGDGVNASIINDCWGYGFIAIDASEIAIGSVGFGSGASGSAGVQAPLANSCYSNTGNGDITNPYNMP